MSLRIAVLVFAATATVPAQNAPDLKGPYHFVYMQLKPSVVATGGTLVFDGSGGYKFKEAAGRVQAQAADFAFSLSNPAQADSQLRVRYNEGASALMGSSETASDLFVAVKAATGGANDQSLNGVYGLAQLVVRDGTAAGLATSFGDVTANGGGAFTKTSMVNHLASFDETNRLEERTGSTYAIQPDGSGKAKFEGPSETLVGERDIFVSAGGEFLLGYSAQHKEILLGVKRNPEVAMFTFTNAYWINELMAETEFALKPDKTRLGAAAGRLKADGQGSVLVAEQVRMGPAPVHVIASNKYFVGVAATSAIGPMARYGIVNFALGQNNDAFAGAQVGAPGEVTLDHGVFFALRMPMAAASKMAIPANLVSAFHADGSPVSPDKPAAPGSTITLHVEGVKGDVSVLFGGKPGEVVSPPAAGANKLQVKLPAGITAPAGTVPVAVRTADTFIDVLDLPVRAGG